MSKTATRKMINMLMPAIHIHTHLALNPTKHFALNSIVPDIYFHYIRVPDIYFHYIRVRDSIILAAMNARNRSRIFIVFGSISDCNVRNAATIINMFEQLDCSLEGRKLKRNATLQCQLTAKSPAKFNAFAPFYPFESQTTAAGTLRGSESLTTGC